MTNCKECRFFEDLKGAGHFSSDAGLCHAKSTIVLRDVDGEHCKLYEQEERIARLERAIERLEQTVKFLGELNAIYHYPENWKCKNCKHRHLMDDGGFYCFQISSRVINTMGCKWFEESKGGESNE